MLTKIGPPYLEHALLGRKASEAQWPWLIFEVVGSFLPTAQMLPCPAQQGPLLILAQRALTPSNNS